LIVKRLTLQTAGLVYLEVVVFKEDNMSAVLTGNAFTHGAVAGVIVYRVFVCMGVNVVAPSGIFV
jgi:hypothetical protein